MKFSAATVLAAGITCSSFAQTHPCPADTNIDGQVTPTDFTAWVSAYNAGDADIADQNGDGVVTPTDFTAWINNYNTGCDFDDTDNDRIPDLYENNTGQFYRLFATGTNPNNPDSDGDNLFDGDEVYGTTTGVNLPGMGANPNHKTVFVEIDWTEDDYDTAFHSHRPRPGMVSRVQAAFANAPLSNPDGIDGVDFIIDYGQGGLFTGGTEILDGQNPEFLVFSYNWLLDNMDPSRHGYFHHGVFTHRYNNSTNGSSGVAFLNADAFFVTLYQFWDWDEGNANTLMHEIGHNFGLRHGGFENRNRKPNYNSVMNYNNQFPGIDTDCDGFGDGVLDYSRGFNPELNENALVEADGICGVPIDWNESGSINGGTVSRNINCSNLNTTSCGNSGSCDDNTCDILRDQNDWDAMNFLGQNRMIHPVMIECDNPVPNP
ncbi:MAG: hypothetical protein Phyf2KO_25590 [Phycisphaerales bacterium]